MKARSRRADRFAVQDGVFSCGHHGARGVGQGGGHLNVAVAKTVAQLAREYVVHEIRVMGLGQLRWAHRLEAAKLDFEGRIL